MQISFILKRLFAIAVKEDFKVFSTIWNIGSSLSESRRKKLILGPMNLIEDVLLFILALKAWIINMIDQNRMKKFNSRLQTKFDKSYSNINWRRCVHCKRSSRKRHKGSKTIFNQSGSSQQYTTYLSVK